MSKSPATDIAMVLETKGIGKVGVNIFIGEDAPPKPDFLVTVHDTGVYTPDSPNLGYKQPTIQVVVRDVKGGYQNGISIAYKINDELHGITALSKNESSYVLIFNLSGPMAVGYDDSRRPLFSVNFRTMRIEE